MFSHSAIFFWFYLVSLYIRLYVLYASVELCKLFIFIVMYSYFNVYVFLLLCMFRSGYSVSLCCSVYCSFVNVYCTTATGCQLNCS